VYKPSEVRRIHHFGVTPPNLEPFVPVPALAANQYDPKVAYLTTLISAWAYSDGQTMANQLPYYGLPNCTVREFTVVNSAMLIISAAYFVRSSDGRLGILAFRGTVPNDILNWLTDANTTLTNFHFGRIHTGVYRNVEPLWGPVAEELDKATNPSTDLQNGGGSLAPLENLYITGHSLGAAMAVIAAARIFTSHYAAWQPLVRGVYTYGQPSVGDKNFADEFQSRFSLFRHVFRDDVVPHLPPSDLGAFPHFGTEFYAARPGDGWQQSKPSRTTQARLVTLAAAIAGASFLARRLTVFDRLQLPYSLEDHGPQGYIDASHASLR